MIFYKQLIEGLKRYLEQNKELFKEIYEIKVIQEKFQQETREKIAEISRKIDQLMVQEDSYWKVFKLYHILYYKYQLSISYYFLFLEFGIESM